MIPVTRGPIFVWLAIVVAVVASLVLSIVRLADLHDLPILLGPDLTVRSVRMDLAPGLEAQQFQRGDRLVAVQRQAVDDLRDLRSVLPHFHAQIDGASEPVSDDGMALIDYQIVRPLHRFSIALQADSFDPTTLPAGVEPRDRLVELDGRLLPGKVGPEGVRSIVASRPDALLGFERANAVFVGQVRVQAPTTHHGIVLAFGLGGLIVLVLWRYRSSGLHSHTPQAVALETLGIAWIFLLAFQYQWVMADYVLASAVIVSLIMMRPLAIYARDISTREDVTRGRAAIGLGLVGSIALIGFLFGGQLPDAEAALQAAAIFAALFLIYEIFVTGIEQDSPAMLGERGGYLVGIVLLSLFAAVVAGVMEPVVFQEDRWRWFAVLIPALVWFGDVLFCLRHGGGHGWAELTDSPAREAQLREYFEEIAQALPGVRLQLVLHSYGQSVSISTESGQLSVEPADDALNDAVTILLQENAQIPLLAGDEREAHPMTGIAQTMRIALGLRLNPPPYAVHVDELALVLIATHGESEDGTNYQVSPDVLDLAQKHLSGVTWAAALFEGLSALARRHEASAHAHRALVARAREAETRSEALSVRCDALDETLLEVRQERTELAEQVAFMRQQWLDARPSLEECERMLEPALLEGVRFLLQTPEPIVVAGARGAGKKFVAWTAHLIDGRPAERFASYACIRGAEAVLRNALLGGAPVPGVEESAGLVSRTAGGTLFVEGCERLDDEVLSDLVDAAQKHGVRLWLAFTAENAEELSVLEGRDDAVVETLGHRELVIPSFYRRRLIMRPVLLGFLSEAAGHRGKNVEGFSSMALQALEAYRFPGELDEARMLIELAVARARHDVIDLDDLNLEVAAPFKS